MLKTLRNALIGAVLGAATGGAALSIACRQPGAPPPAAATTWHQLASCVAAAFEAPPADGGRQLALCVVAVFLPPPGDAGADAAPDAAGAL